LTENVPADFNRAKLVTLVKIRSPTHFRHFVAKGRPIVLPLVVPTVVLGKSKFQ
jgi:hypothetical protein